MKPEIYVSTDIETDGPIPGPHSMLSLGSAAYDGEKKLVGTFAANFETLPGATGHPDNMAWWESQPEAWAACQVNRQDPEKVMVQYNEWLNALPGRPIFVGYPVAWDFMFVYWYLIKFTASSPLGHSGIDIKSYAMGNYARTFAESGKQHLPPCWIDDLPHSHVALDDAKAQGALFCNMRIANEMNKGSYKV